MDYAKNTENHKRICYELNALYDRKNRDYGDSFHDTYLSEGMAMPRIRLTDKLNRFCNITKGKTVQNIANESVRDTLLDLANYAIMTVMELDAGSEPKYEPLRVEPMRLETPMPGYKLPVTTAQKDRSVTTFFDSNLKSWQKESTTHAE